MKPVFILPLVLAALLVSGCATVTEQERQRLDKETQEFVEKLYSASPLRQLEQMMKAIDLTYCSCSFSNKNGRWPNDYAEIVEFVKQSNGYLFLGKYERVELKPMPDNSLQITHVPLGQTNEVEFSLGP